MTQAVRGILLAIFWASAILAMEARAMAFDVSITVDRNLRQVAVVLSGAHGVVHDEALAALQVVGAGMQNYVVTQKLRGGALQHRTGTLGSAIFFQVEDGGSNGPMLVRIGADLGIAIYARIQDQGGTVTPTNSQFLTIPLDAALTAGGVARFSAREVISDPSQWGYRSTFFAKGVLFGVPDGEGNEIVPLFALKTSVSIKPTGYLSGSFDERKDWIQAQFVAAMSRVGARLSVVGA